jgi:hypothetical protein
MAKNTSSTTEKNGELGEEFMAEEAESGDFEGEEEVAQPRAAPKDASIRRKIEDRLERIRLREQLGIYDDARWEDI